MEKGDETQLLKYLLKEKGIVIRERTPIAIILYSVFLYAQKYTSGERV